MTGTIRLRHVPQEGKDTNLQTVRSTDGYKYHLAPNESKVLADTDNNTALASNATVVWGSSTAQASAPHVEADIPEQPART
jgi:hypothetical protein